MLNIYKPSSFLLPILLIMSSACGGGGDGEDTRNIRGLWRGSLTQQSNTCGNRSAVSPKVVLFTGSFTHTVDQNEDAVDLNDGNGTSFLGNIVGDDGFSVDAITKQDNSVNNSVTCDESQRIAYDNIDDNSDTTANVILTTSKQCSDGISCQIISIGSASRSNVDTTPPADDDADGTTNLSSCGDLAEREYSGDSGCNIGQITTSTMGNIILLNPLGANGATSFTIDGTDSAVATAANADLQIMGDTGYSCSINCSGRLTFTLNCFKEGGIVCAEKF